MKANSPGLLLIGRLGASALALVSAPIVARAIGPDGRGETAAAVALFALVPVVLGMGLPLELRRIVALEGKVTAVRSSRRIVLGSVLLSIPISFLCASTIFHEFDEQARIAAALGVALTPLTLSWICDTSALVAVRDFRGIVALQLLQPSTYLVGIVLLWATNSATTASVIWAYILSNGVSFVFGLIRVRASTGQQPPTLRVLMKGSVRFAGGTLAESASNRLDQVLALPVLGAVQAGFYSVSVTVGLAPLAIAQAISTSFFTPIATSEGRRRFRLVNDSIRQVSSLSFAAAVALVLFGPSIVTFLFGDAFQDAGLAIQISGVNCFLAGIALQASSNLVAIGRPKHLAISQFISLIVGIIALVLFGPPFGAAGAASASTVGYSVLALLSVVQCKASAWSVVPSPFYFVAGIKGLLKSK